VAEEVHLEQASPLVDRQGLDRFPSASGAAATVPGRLPSPGATRLLTG
jgi:hypothetical protein